MNKPIVRANLLFAALVLLTAMLVLPASAGAQEPFVEVDITSVILHRAPGPSAGFTVVGVARCSPEDESAFLNVFISQTYGNFHTFSEDAFLSVPCSPSGNQFQVSLGPDQELPDFRPGRVKVVTLIEACDPTGSCLAKEFVEVLTAIPQPG
jgi:aspartate/methionine/tyrosine aminotransferase